MPLIPAKNSSKFACIILAAGQSKRMGQSKMVLPWGDKTVIGSVICAFTEANIGKIVVVTGGYRELVETEIKKYPVDRVYNQDFANGEMSTSLQTGIKRIDESIEFIFVALGDQPDISPEDIREMMNLANGDPTKLIIPSYSMRRGHPWLIPSIYFSEIMGLRPPETMRSFINKHEDNISYYLVKKSNILADLDTPEDYQRLKPKE